ncbi:MULTISPECIES: NrfD/PsrC family molybdoenzyme membrane anchor subunit [Brevibacterium]|uniref:Polysulphide reductase, NrfD n=1 Tax=Brevibacterium antiquum CNRZ 918 TaxID=1255637 RepID=A0A2H1I629_9MICO|nr:MULTISPECIES: NrfD/PsrC family molybdoenzyme membrane anchor subunit [Brevibacterium]SMX70649.1 Polysulphide reductase, NrfD [Brevibacterium antiquum CNRZ 918]HCG55125.1 polysulfide reductase [Brevibacterium sp.]
MSTSEYDSYRPPELDRGRKKRRRGGRPGSGPGGNGGAGRGGGGGGGQGWKNRGADGNREMPMVEDVEFSSYYGRSIVKAPPWGDEIALYLFLGGLAGGSSLLGLGAQFSDRPQLRIATRLTAITATGVGGAALVADLGRPERFLNMMRVFKVSSPMSLGTWILSGFGVGSGVLAAIEADRLTGLRLPLGPLRSLLHAMETPAAFESALFATPLAAYTGALLGDTAVPTWNAAGRNGLSYVFVSSAAVAAGGAAMALAPVRETGPARLLALAGAAGEAFAMNRMKQGMHPAEVDPLEDGEPGRKLHRAEKLLIAGAIGTAAVEVGARVFTEKLGRGGSTGVAGLAVRVAGAAGRRSWKTRAALRAVSVVSGAALAAASAYTRFGVLEAGIESTKDPRHVVEPQRARLEERRARGIVDDSITTGV